MTAERRRIIVVGGGITGLAAAWFLRDRADVTVLEASGRIGGKILTEDFGGLPVESGPDAFLARRPEAVELCQSLGLAGELVPPTAGEAYLWTRGRLRRLPAGLVLGVPTSIAPLARSGILPPMALARAVLDVVLPKRGATGDRSVGDVVAARFGRATHERLVDPLLGGIHAGRSEQLSIQATAPQLASAAAGSRSLMAALRRQQKQAPPAGGPVFLTVRGGLTTMVDRLAGALGDVRLDTPVTRIDRAARGDDDDNGGGGGWTVDGKPADAVILTVDAKRASRLVLPHSSVASRELEAIPYAGVALVTLAYAEDAWPDPLPGSGFLVPRREGRLMTACTFGSQKWAQWARPGSVVLRVSAGRDGDERALQMDDDDLVTALHCELVEALGLRRRPELTRVSRWPDGFAQYRPGHLERVARIEKALAGDMPGVVVAGAAYRGVGIPACIASARQAADAAMGASSVAYRSAPVSSSTNRTISRIPPMPIPEER
ncbi:MAG: protoporphyrinogen/coproporphyrinogen oxidase [Acidimicrobiaceae bacterium]|nr:protoporphyrinogen/coproporphyrinogen oxidase [Acidimicrobiaceae bacterium]